MSVRRSARPRKQRDVSSTALADLDEALADETPEEEQPAKPRRKATPRKNKDTLTDAEKLSLQTMSKQVCVCVLLLRPLHGGRADS